jgi:uncharacterized protein
LSDAAPGTEPLSLAQLPLFPLQTVLFPDGLLPLRIFEVRYLDMIGRCHKAGVPFGVVCLSQGSEVRRINRAAPPTGDAFAKEVFHPIGTLAHIEHLERPQPGLMHIRCRAGQRFRLTQHQQLPHGLWIGDVQLVPPDTVVPVPEYLESARDALERLLRTLQAQEPKALQELSLQPPYRWEDSGWVANRWAELLPEPAEVKQRLMTLDNPLVRLELVADLLERLDPRI